jgi:hypothetical protein
MVRKVPRTPRLNPAESFFYANAGYSYGPGETPEEGRAKGAKKLARAERKANALGWKVTWSVDPNIDSSEFSDEKPWSLWECVMRSSDGDGESLSGIDFGRDGGPYGDPYARVVEAELALAIMGRRR